MVYAAEMLGQIFGGDAKTKSESWIAEFNKARTEMEKRLADVPESERPVAYEILADKDRGPFRTYDGDNQAWLSYAGGILATKDYADATSQAMPTEEAILATNPDIIFIGGTYATKEYESLLKNEMWQNIAAVENGNIFNDLMQVIKPIGEAFTEIFGKFSAANLLAFNRELYSLSFILQPTKTLHIMDW